MSHTIHRFFSTSRSRASRVRSIPTESNRVRPQTQQQHKSIPAANTASSHQQQTPPKSVFIVLGGYFALVNAGSFGLFAYDKFQAKTKGWRVPERQLQLSALLGGWVGGIIAMEAFRHKTVKKSFRDGYFAAVAGNIVLLGAAAFSWRRNPLVKQWIQRNISV